MQLKEFWYTDGHSYVARGGINRDFLVCESVLARYNTS